MRNDTDTYFKLYYANICKIIQFIPELISYICTNKITQAYTVITLIILQATVLKFLANIVVISCDVCCIIDTWLSSFAT